MHTNYPLIEILDDEYRAFCLDHDLDDERIANARLSPGLRRWLRDYEARLAAARVLAPLAARALVAEYDTEEHEAAHNAFAHAVAPYMTNAQRRKWDDWCLKATDVEQIDEAFRILGLPSSRELKQIEEASATPPSVADYFEQKLSAKLPDPFTGGDTIDKTKESSPAHPDFHIHSGCGVDCKAAIDAAAMVLPYLQGEESPDAVSAALVGASALLLFVRGSIPSTELIEAANNVLAVVRLDAERSAETPSEVRRLAAEVVNCYVYG